MALCEYICTIIYITYFKFKLESINWTPAVTGTGDWSGETFSSSLDETCANLKIAKDKQYSEEALVFFQSNLKEGTFPVLSCLVSKRSEPVENICASVIQLLPKFSKVEDVVDDDLIVPAFLKVFVD